MSRCNAMSSVSMLHGVDSSGGCVFCACQNDDHEEHTTYRPCWHQEPKCVLIATGQYSLCICCCAHCVHVAVHAVYIMPCTLFALLQDCPDSFVDRRAGSCSRSCEGRLYQRSFDHPLPSLSCAARRDLQADFAGHRRKTLLLCRH